MSHPTYDHGLPLRGLEERQLFAEEGTFMAALGPLLVRAGALASMREVKTRTSSMKVTVVPAAASRSTFPLFVTRDLRSQFEWWPGDTLSVNELHSCIPVEPLTSSS